MTINEAVELAIAYRDYGIREFNQCEVPTIDDSGTWGMMYTTAHYNEDYSVGYDLQVDLDYINKRWLYYVDGDLVNVEDIGDVTISELATIIYETSWDSLYSECNSYGVTKYERED